MLILLSKISAIIFVEGCIHVYPLRILGKRYIIKKINRAVCYPNNQLLSTCSLRLRTHFIEFIVPYIVIRAIIWYNWNQVICKNNYIIGSKGSGHALLMTI